MADSAKNTESGNEIQLSEITVEHDDPQQITSREVAIQTDPPIKGDEEKLKLSSQDTREICSCIREVCKLVRMCMDDDDD